MGQARPRPGDTQKGIGDGDHLAFDRRGARNVIDEHIFIRAIGDELAVRPEDAVEAAGQDEQGLAVRRHRHGGGLTGGEARIAGKTRIERLKDRARRGRRGSKPGRSA